MKVLNFGSINIDHVYSLSHLVREGETIASDTYRRNEGGKGLNQSIALSRAGAEVYHAGAIGRDGKFLLDYLAASGVNTDDVHVLDVPTGHAMIQVDAQGRNSIVLYAGANHAIDGTMIREVLNHFSAGDFMLVQNETTGLRELLELGAQKGLRIVLNPSPITPELRTLPLEKAEWLILNEIEGEELTGESEPEKILSALTARYAHTRIVLTLGEKGSVYAYGGERIAQQAYRAHSVDTTAAGDTFTGYFIAGVMRGESVQCALNMASKASAIAVTRMGAGASIPARTEVEAALREQCG